MSLFQVHGIICYPGCHYTEYRYTKCCSGSQIYGIYYDRKKFYRANLRKHEKKLKVAILESFNIKLGSFVTKRNEGKVHKRPHLELKIGTKVGVICHCPV